VLRAVAKEMGSHLAGVNVMTTIFGDFGQFSVEKMAIFLENQCYDHFLYKVAQYL
jgi:hypothetical protein